jgi:hypothetical protein
MKSISKILVAITMLLSFSICNAQIKNEKKVTVSIKGNCDMCKGSIEQAGNVKNTAIVNWNKDTKMATITYDAKKTNQDEILKRIALAGYDSDSFLAPDNAYAKLPECCQYERTAKKTDKAETPKMQMNDHTAMTDTRAKTQQLKAVFENYFAVKDALVKTDGNTASTKATALLSTIGAVKMEQLTTEEHNVWMKIMKDLAFDTEHIADTKSADHQRDHFTTLSKNMYSLMKVSKQDTPIYYQHCPMFDKGKGADWLSKEKSIKNPYYGSQMLTCGKTIETIK